MPLDQVGFEQQGLGFGVSNRKLDAVGGPNHPADAVAPWVDIGANPRANVDRLPDVEDGLAVEKLVDTRLAGCGGRPLAERLAIHAGTSL